MQQANRKGWHSAQGPPQALARAFEGLAPGVAQACPQAVEAARAFVFQDTAPGRRRLRRQLHALLGECARQGIETEKGLLFTVLEGLAAIREAHRLASEAELEGFFQAHKEAFRPLFSL